MFLRVRNRIKIVSTSNNDFPGQELRKTARQAKSADIGSPSAKSADIGALSEKALRNLNLTNFTIGIITFLPNGTLQNSPHKMKA